MKKAIIRPHSLFNNIFGFLVVSILIFLFGYVNYMSIVQTGKVEIPLILAFVFIPISAIIFAIFINPVDLTEILVFDNHIELVYRSLKRYKIKEIKKIRKDNIEKFVLLSMANYVTKRIGKTRETSREIISRVSIHLLNGKKINFVIKPEFESFFSCDCRAIFNILAIADSIPNFSFAIKGNDKETIANIEFFRMHGREKTASEKVCDVNFLKKIAGILLVAIVLTTVIVVLFSN